MLRRCTPSVTAATLPALCCAARGIAGEFKDIRPRNNGGGGAAPPPSIHHNEPLLPMDFNPHIEWFEYPKEIFDPKFPYTREERHPHDRGVVGEHDGRDGEQVWHAAQHDDEADLLAGLVHHVLLQLVHPLGLLPCDGHGARVVALPERGDEPALGAGCWRTTNIYLDQWMRPEMREKFSRYDRFWNWKPLVNRDGAKTTWQIPMQYSDESEWKHMTSRV